MILRCTRRAAHQLLSLVADNKRRVAIMVGGLVLLADVAAVAANVFWLGGTAETNAALGLLLAFNIVTLVLVGMLVSDGVKPYFSRVAGLGAGDYGEDCGLRAIVRRLVDFVTTRRPLRSIQPPAAATTDREATADLAMPVGAPPAERLDAARTALREAVERLPPPRLAEASGKRAYPAPRFGSRAPCVTIVVPLFNEERFVSDAIDSLRRQTVGNFEVFVVDDASTDGSAAVAMRAIGSDSRFKLVRHLRNSGLSASRNTGLRLAAAPYITFLDADDILLPDALEIRLARFGEETDDRLAGVYCGVAPASEWVTADHVPAKRGFEGKRHTFVSTEGECPFNAHAPILRTDLLRRLGGFDETLRSGCEDWELWQRVMRHGYWFEPVNRVAAVYRRKSGSMVRSLPLEHVLGGRLIVKWAFSPLLSEETVPGTPFVFTDGVGDYRSEAGLLRRMVHFGAMAFMRDPDVFRQFLPDIAGDLLPYAMRDLEMRQVVAEAILRFLAIDGAEGAALGADLAAARDAIIAHYLDAAARNRQVPSTVPPKTRTDIVLFASNAKHATLMADLHVGLVKKGRFPLLVSTETMSGDQGAESVWAERGLPYASYNTYVLRQWRFAAPLCVVMRPYDKVLHDLAAGSDATIVEMVDPAAPVGLPDENIPAAPAVVVRMNEALAELDRLLSAHGPDAMEPIVARSPAPVPARIGTSAPFILPKEERLDLSPDYERLRAFKDRYKGERCFIIGNGPSLNTLDLTKLKDEHTFAVNGIFYKSDEMGFDPTFYVVEDTSVMKENVEAIRAYRAKHKFFPTIYRDLHPADANVQFFLMNRGFYEREGAFFCVPRFSVDAARRVFCGQSVTHINLQLAYYFGFSKVYLIGMDFSYVIPQSAIVKGDLIISTEDDPNHFHASYFGAGKSWKDPKLHRVKLNYEVSRDIFSAAGREIVNATNGGNLEVFRREAYDSLF